MTRVPRLDLLPATMDLSGAEVELVALDDRAHRLDKALGATPSGRWIFAYRLSAFARTAHRQWTGRRAASSGAASGGILCIGGP